MYDMPRWAQKHNFTSHQTRCLSGAPCMCCGCPLVVGHHWCRCAGKLGWLPAWLTAKPRYTGRWGYHPVSCKVWPRCMVLHGSQQGSPPGVSSPEGGFQNGSCQARINMAEQYSTNGCYQCLSPLGEYQVPPSSLVGTQRLVSRSPSCMVYLLFDLVFLYWLPGWVTLC